MKIKLLILSLSFLLISCGGPPSEDSKTTIMDVVKYLEQVEHKEFNKWKAKAFGVSVEEYLNARDRDNSEKKVCGKFKNYKPKIASMVGAVEGGKITFSNSYACRIEVYRYSSESSANLNAKSGFLDIDKCFAKGYFIFCDVLPPLMHDF